MVSTVTTTVISVITTSTTTNLAASLGLAAVLALIAFLVTKELASASDGARVQLLGRNLDIPVFALLFVFAFIVIMKVLEILAK